MAAGSSNFVTDYEAWDESPYSGRSYYRLRQTDIDGRVKWSDVRAVDFNNKLAMSIYPNPVTNDLSFEIKKATHEKLFVKVFDMEGRTLYSFQLNQNSTLVNARINTAKLQAGIYILEIRGLDEIYREKFVKEF
jgi:hypothetical protein